MRDVQKVDTSADMAMRITTKSGSVYMVSAPNQSGLRKLTKYTDTYEGVLGVAVDAQEAGRLTCQRGMYVGSSELSDGRFIVPVEEINIGDCLGFLSSDKKRAGIASSPIVRIEVLD